MARLDAQVEEITLRLKHPFTIARESSSTKTAHVLTLRYGGAEGIGEAVGSVRYGQGPAIIADGLDRLARGLPRDPSSLHEVRDAVRRLGAREGPIPSGVLMAVDLALLDLEGRLEGRPVHALLGLAAPSPMETSFTIGMDTPVHMEAKAREAAGFGILKVKMGNAGDLEGLAAVRRVFAGRVRVDANEGWSVEEAPGRIAAAARMGVEMVEQPIPAGLPEGLARLSEGGGLAVFADEDCVTLEDVRRLTGRVAGVTVKLMKHGGLTQSLEIVREARARGLSVMLGCMVETSLGITAALHLGALADTADLDGHLLITNDPFRGAIVRQGVIALPEGVPGLCVTRAIDQGRGTGDRSLLTST